MAKAKRNWIQEERRRTLGDWVAFCPSCGHVARYFEDHEDGAPGGLPAVRDRARRALPLVRRAAPVGLPGRVRGVRRPAARERALRRPDPPPGKIGRRRKRGEAEATPPSVRRPGSHLPGVASASPVCFHASRCSSATRRARALSTRPRRPASLRRDTEAVAAPKGDAFRGMPRRGRGSSRGIPLLRNPAWR